MNHIRIVYTILFTFTLCSCGSKGEFHLNRVDSATLLESDSVHIIVPKAGVVTKDENILLLSSRTKVILLDPNTGNLSDYLSIGTSEADTIYSFLKNNLSGFKFIDEKYKAGKYTLKIDQICTDSNYLYLGLTAQFFIEAEYNGERIAFFPFFSILHKYDMDTKKLLNIILVPEYPKTKLTDKGKGGGNYAACEDGLYVNNDIIYVKNVHQPVNDTCRFLYKLTKKAGNQYNKELLDISSDTKKIKGAVNLNRFSFSNWKTGPSENNLFCSDGKDVYNILKENKYMAVIDDSNIVIQSFNIIDNDMILVAEKNTKENELGLFLYDHNTRKCLIPSSRNEKIYLFGENIYCISMKGNHYDIDTYEIQ